MIPAGFEDRMRPLLGEETGAFLRCLDEPVCRGLRLNPRRKHAEEAAKDYIDGQVPWCPAGRYVREGTAPGKDILHAAGAYYMQEPSAMAPAEVMDARPGEWILDLCAAPGGKSGRLADGLAGRGALVSNEIEPSRAKILASNLERLGVVNAIVTCASPQALAEAWGETFDGVLVDAPCSGEGMFRRVPEARDEWDEGSPAGCAARQAKILDSAAAMVAPGGRMVYSTCTFNRQENEDNIEAFLDRHPEFVPAEFRLEGVGESKGGCLRLWPHRLRGEGHFVAKLIKGGEPRLRKSGMWKTDKAAMAAFETLKKEALGMAPRWLSEARISLIGDKLVALPEGPAGKALVRGVVLGRVGRGYVNPEHALAMALMPEEAACVREVDEDGAWALLSGRTIDCPGRGWTLAVYKGMPLCWGKCVDGVMKNHLPKGLRVDEGRR